MSRGVKPTKPKAAAKPSVARKSAKEGSRVRDLEKRLAESLEREKAKNHALTEAWDQQTATAAILRVISSSPTDLAPVMDAVAENAARVCGAADAVIYRLEADELRRVAHFGLRSAGSSWNCTAAGSGSRANWDEARHSRSGCRCAVRSEPARLHLTHDPAVSLSLTGSAARQAAITSAPCPTTMTDAGVGVPALRGPISSVSFAPSSR